MIFIPGNVPSSKNSKVWTGKFLVDSAITKNYRSESAIYYARYRDQFIQELGDRKPPYPVCFTFIRGTKHRFDYHNAIQIVADLMVEYDWLEDDNATILHPSFGVFVYDKLNPGVQIDVRF